MIELIARISSLSPHTSPHQHRHRVARLTLLLTLIASAVFGVAATPKLVAAQGCAPTITALAKANVRRGPGVRYTLLTSMQRGDVASVVGRLRNNSWYRIVFRGIEGWVFGQLTQPACLQAAPIVPAQPVPQQPPMQGAIFVAVPTRVAAGQCSTLNWIVDNVAAVFLIDGGVTQGVRGVDARVVCPPNTTTYILRVQRRDNSFFDQTATVAVGPVGPAPGQPNFRADATSIAVGQCTTLRWNVDNVAAVFLITGNTTQGVAGNASQAVCPPQTTTYVLRVQRRDGTTFDTPLVITVGGSQPNFRADSTTVAPGQCTALRWNVDNVRAVFFWDGNNRQGVGGNDSRTVCPTVTTAYRLEVTGNDGRTNNFFITVTVSGSGSPNATIDSFTADNVNLTRGQCTSLRWQVGGAAQLIQLFDGGNASTVGATGVVSVCPQNTSTYVLRVTAGNGGVLERSLTVNVNVPATVVAPTAQP